MATVHYRCPFHRRYGIVVVVAMLLCLTACSGDDDGPVVPPPTEDPGVVNLGRRAWSLASLPVDPGADGEAPRLFSAQDRVGTIRWFIPNPPVLRRYLEPDIGQSAGQASVPTLDLYLRPVTGIWGPSSWGGIMCSPAVTGTGFPDMSAMAWLDIWVNDGTPDPAQRTGRLHVDFGRLDEDGFWPRGNQGQLVTGLFEQEDGITSGMPDGVWTYQEDIGLDGCDDSPCSYGADYEWYGDAPYPRINNMARNRQEDTEDIDHNGQWDQANSYFTYVIDLATTIANVDVVQDYEDVEDLIANGIAWRLYRIPIRRALTVVNASGEPDLADIRHFRVWLEDTAPGAPNIRWLQLAGIRFH